MLEFEFGLIDIALTALGASTFSTFICLFMLGASTLQRESDAYRNGYHKGFEDGKKVGGSNDI
jgi:hypothetical protein